MTQLCGAPGSRRQRQRSGRRGRLGGLQATGSPKSLLLQLRPQARRPRESPRLQLLLPLVEIEVGERALLQPLCGANCSDAASGDSGRHAARQRRRGAAERSCAASSAGTRAQRRRHRRHGRRGRSDSWLLEAGRASSDAAPRPRRPQRLRAQAAPRQGVAGHQVVRAGRGQRRPAPPDAPPSVSVSTWLSSLRSSSASSRARRRPRRPSTRAAVMVSRVGSPEQSARVRPAGRSSMCRGLGRPGASGARLPAAAPSGRSWARGASAPASGLCASCSSVVMLPSPAPPALLPLHRLTAEMKEIASISRVYGSFLERPCAGDRSVGQEPQLQPLHPPHHST